MENGLFCYPEWLHLFLEENKEFTSIYWALKFLKDTIERIFPLLSAELSPQDVFLQPFIGFKIWMILVHCIEELKRSIGVEIIKVIINLAKKFGKRWNYVYKTP